MIILELDQFSADKKTILFYCFLAMLGHITGKCSITKLHPQPSEGLFCQCEVPAGPGVHLQVENTIGEERSRMETLSISLK